MNPAQALDEHRVSYYRIVARSALAVARGADVRSLLDQADYVSNPRLAPLVPELSSMPPQFTSDELWAMDFLAQEDDNVRRLLDKDVARHFFRADILACIASYYAGQRVAHARARLAG